MISSTRGSTSFCTSTFAAKLAPLPKLKSTISGWSATGSATRSRLSCGALLHARRRRATRPVNGSRTIGVVAFATVISTSSGAPSGAPQYTRKVSKPSRLYTRRCVTVDVTFDVPCRRRRSAVRSSRVTTSPAMRSVRRAAAVRAARIAASSPVNAVTWTFVPSERRTASIERDVAAAGSVGSGIGPSSTIAAGFSLLDHRRHPFHGRSERLVVGCGVCHAGPSSAMPST